MTATKPPHWFKKENLIYVVNTAYHAVKYYYKEEDDQIILTPSNYTQEDWSERKLLMTAAYYLLMIKDVRCLYSTSFFEEL